MVGKVSKLFRKRGSPYRLVIIILNILFIVLIIIIPIRRKIYEL